MTLRLAALAACFACMLAAMPARAGETLDLDDAFDRVLQFHPDLRQIDARRPLLSAERELALLAPALNVDATLENAFGSGDLRALHSAELTIGLSSLLERGGKADARAALVQGQIDGLGSEREARRMDLLAETARRHLAAIAASSRRQVALEDIEQRQKAVNLAAQRLQAGASPASVVLAAKAALAGAELDLARASQQHDAAVQHLAALWGERAPGLELAPADPTRLPAIASMAQLDLLLQQSPELTRFADRARIAEARLQLARSQSVPDIGWGVGLRRLQADNDTGLVAAISIPLGNRQRAEPAIHVAEAQLQVLGIEREAESVSLYSTLVDAHGRYRLAQMEVSRLGEDIIPALKRAETDAARAFRLGAASHLEWTQLQDQIVEARRQQLASAVDGQRALIELQRLTGEPLLARDTSPRTQGSTP